eukprot:TRINITY_DN259_c0_g1_i1.p1 TRINITY_DN259_c0_g1~~TRINITY_DN259_c0_g1_i1.p1  ORF type:complete len:181 (-),score=11.62 TRINITY_DN259_c0_g1_i1:84-626(-)
MSTCGGCGELITDMVLEAFGMTWHPYHLCCNGCGCDFTTGKVHEGEDGFAYCDRCHVRAFSTICAGCDDIVEGDVVNAMEVQWHPNCFACNTCKEPLSDSFFPGPDGMPYCEPHYYESQGLLCSGCERPILVGKCVNFLKTKYHPECFKCSFCKKALAGMKYAKHNEKPYCQPCHIKLHG